MTESEKFDKFMKQQRWGGVYEPPLRPDGTYSHEDFLINGFKGFTEGIYQKPNKKNFRFLPITRLNNIPIIDAFVVFDGQQHYVSVSMGLIKTLEILFNLLAAQPTFFPEIGNSNLEFQTNRKFEKLEFVDWNQLKYKWPGVDEVYPKCPIRQDFAQYLLHIAVIFIFLHEAAHLTGGHCDGESKKPIYEISKRSEEEKRNLYLQCLEMDADARAIHETLNEFREIIINPVHSSLERFKKFYGDEINGIKYLVNALYLFFKIIGPEQLKKEEFLKVDHPPIISRQLCFVNIIKANYSDEPEKIEDVRQAIKAGVEQLEAGLQNLSEKKIEPLLTQENKVLTDDHYKLLVDSWPSVHDKLQPYAYVNLPIYKRTPVNL
ncbi:MAG: hypothetical protein JKY70_02335 [Mucilaginibacter sp.]|nr:hypothetical protein [Mucilaginibacter sp.]